MRAKIENIWVQAGILVAFRLNLNGMAEKALWANAVPTKIQSSQRSVADWWKLALEMRAFENSFIALEGKPHWLHFAALTGRANKRRTFSSSNVPSDKYAKEEDLSPDLPLGRVLGLDLMQSLDPSGQLAQIPAKQALKRAEKQLRLLSARLSNCPIPRKKSLVPSKGQVASPQTKASPSASSPSPLAEKLNQLMKEHNCKHRIPQKAAPATPTTLLGALWQFVKSYAKLHPAETIILAWMVLKKGKAWLIRSVVS